MQHEQKQRGKLRSQAAKIDHARVLTERMMVAFDKAAQGILKTNYQNTVVREKGLYGFFIAKPSRRMASTLSLEREVLVLLSSFDDQQPRTVDTAREIIESSQGRLESSLAVVVHRDPKGNNKLKIWGREQGISILPVYFGSDALPKGNEFERLLAVELYSYDPFDVSGPVADDAQFYGRREEAINMAKRLQQGLIRSCLGIRKIGKTSIITRALNVARDTYDCNTLVIDCSRDDIFAQDAAGLLDTIASAIKSPSEGPAHLELRGAKRHDVEMPEAVGRLDTALSQIERPLIIIFDEVDYITPSSPTAGHWAIEFNKFWRNLRASYQGCVRRGKNLSVVVCGVSSKWFSVESIEGVENAALAFIPEEYLSPLPRGASVAMIKRLGRVAGLQFNEDVAEAIGGCCSDMPYWIRKACSYIHRQIEPNARPLEITFEMVRSFLDSFVRTDGGAIAQVALQHLFRVYPELEPICVGLGRGEKVVQSTAGIRTLQKYGILRLEPELKISGEMIKLGLENYLEERKSAAADVPTQRPAAKSMIAMQLSFGEWADEIAAVSRRRNSLERELRSILFNFLMFNSLGDKQKTGPADRIRSVMSPARQRQVEHLQGKDIVEKITWRELCDALCKEWAIFERLLGNRDEFKRISDLLNDRPDAHAKQFDPADFALYRRSLSLLEEKIQRHS